MPFDASYNHHLPGNVIQGHAKKGHVAGSQSKKVTSDTR